MHPGLTEFAKKNGLSITKIENDPDAPEPQYAHEFCQTKQFVTISSPRGSVQVSYGTGGHAAWKQALDIGVKYRGKGARREPLPDWVILDWERRSIVMAAAGWFEAIRLDYVPGIEDILLCLSFDCGIDLEYELDDFAEGMSGTEVLRFAKEIERLQTEMSRLLGHVAYAEFVQTDWEDDGYVG